MASPIIKIKRTTSSGAPTSLKSGELAVDLTNKNLYVGDASEVPFIIGGEGTFAKTADLGTMASQDADSVAITGGAIDGTAIGATTPSTGRFTTIQDDGSGSGLNIFGNQTQFGWGIGGVSGNPLYVSSTLNLSIGSGKIDLGGVPGAAVSGLDAPVNDNDAARKKYVDDAVSSGLTSLGSVFRYAGLIGNSGISSLPVTDLNGDDAWDLDSITDQSTGAYYQIADSAGMPPVSTYGGGNYFDGTNSYKLKVGDAIVKTTTGWQKLDNVDAVVSGTSNEIAVTGNENVGYNVSIDPVFSGRVSTAETDIDDLQTKTQNIDLAATTSGTTKVNGILSIGDITTMGASISDNGTITAVSSGGDKFFEASYFNGITLGAQNSPSNTVSIRNGLVGVDHYMYGMPSIQNFVIDGGVY